mmetsp:Transcript_36425/g.48057  ORF Transcript_36425/g.48057 Transcript_36425/m.48057 type:complete len:213 (-) Transcript_36425:204-842(-)
MFLSPASESVSTTQRNIASLGSLKIVTKTLEQYRRRGINVANARKAKRRTNLMGITAQTGGERQLKTYSESYIQSSLTNFSSGGGNKEFPTAETPCQNFSSEEGNPEFQKAETPSQARRQNNLQLIWGLSTESWQHVIYHTTTEDLTALALTTKKFSWMRSLPENFWKFMYQMRWKKVLYTRETSWLKLFVQMEQRSTRMQQWRQKWEGHKS